MNLTCMALPGLYKVRHYADPVLVLEAVPHYRMPKRFVNLLYFDFKTEQRSFILCSWDDIEEIK